MGQMRSGTESTGAKSPKGDEKGGAARRVHGFDENTVPRNCDNVCTYNTETA